ncbi:glutamate synthase family protein [Elysia marginata]|uniref:glutamate synthase (ferredoxin) n=1 Tax=Elysia marginata TaxID=1093978 RepID=A0AAV4FQT5_9GAST|nr:glutamate synthase family protein [Elysia marginata]
MNKGLYNSEFEHDSCGAGFICDLNGAKRNDIIHKAIDILIRLEHRGAVSADGKTGDGAGILIEIPHLFFKKVCEFDIPEPKAYAVGMVFLPPKPNQLNYAVEQFEKNITTRGLRVIGWRDVPVDRTYVGKIAAKTEPKIKQVFIDKNRQKLSEFEFSNKLFAARKITEHEILNSNISEKNYFYLPSLSVNTIIYKGLLVPEDINRYYVDLNDKDFTTKLALVHQRFSTNTFPTWDLAQPFRYMCHNGEINTLRGNISQMDTREELFKSDIFGEDIKSMLPIIFRGKSDSASMDMALELLLSTGMSLPQAMMIMVPEAWEKHPTMSEEKKSFYNFFSCIMEPWDGPASIPFTDGNYIGALLDRNGLRPSRYTITKDGLLVMSSEAGVLEIPPENIEMHGRLEPGKMFLVDMNAGRIVNDEEVKNNIINQRPYKKWIHDNLLSLSEIPYTGNPTKIEETDILRRQKVFGYTKEDISTLILPMSEQGKEAVGSMGTDVPLSVFSSKPQLLYNYFKQLFAQVTNPPLDGIREEIVTDISLSIGADSNIFDIKAESCKKLRIENPIISNEDLDKIKFNSHPNFNAYTVPALYQIGSGLNGMEATLEEMIRNVLKAIDKHKNIIIISDRGVDKNFAPVPMLLTCSYLHHSLKRHGKRSKVGIVIESAEPREPHHFAMLFGYGASAINPYLVNETIQQQIEQGHLKIDFHTAVKNFNSAIGKGIVKIMNKIGISTLHSYRGSQIFEALGLRGSFVEKYFTNTVTRISGVGLYEIEKEVFLRHRMAFPNREVEGVLKLNIGGQYRWRRNEEHHMFNPTTVAKLQQAVQQNSYTSYEKYAEMINNQSAQLMTIRGMFEFTEFDPIPIEEVEPWTEIVKRFKTGAMSFGSISKEAHENLAIAMNRLGGKSNSGEGGEDPDRFQKDNNGNLRNSAIKQVASGRFGVSIDYLSNAKEIQIKMAQGAKPGEGGQLPGPKVYPWVAKVRNSTPYVGLISPPPHHDIYSIEDLAQLIYDLKNANREARVNVKLVSEVGVGTVATGVAKAKADVILVSGYDGGTGASPLTSLKHAGLPWELGIAEAQQTLVRNNLRDRIVLECDGQLKTGRDVAIACLLGAEEFGFATAPLVASGCIMMRACHLNTCPVGIATQDPVLRSNFKGTPEHVINFMYFVTQELREIMSKIGFRTINEMVGQSQKLDMKKVIKHYKAKRLDLSKILYKIPTTQNKTLYNTKNQNHGLERVLDLTLVKNAHTAIFRKEPTHLVFPIHNTNRTVGAILSNEINKIHGKNGLPKGTLKIDFYGTSGQSFGAFATKGLELTVYGNCNDYFGKSLSGATLVAKIPEKATFKSEENIIIGNVALYGAVYGEAYINGVAGERFCVRNSGARSVVEGIGDHGCEYMTGGVAVILGKIGRNFAAGMSGGIAYIYSGAGDFDEKNFNMEMIDFEPMTDKDFEQLKTLLEKHLLYTNSNIAKTILSDWEKTSKNFIKIMPTDYKIALERIEKEKTLAVS